MWGFHCGANFYSSGRAHNSQGVPSTLQTLPLGEEPTRRSLWAEERPHLISQPVFLDPSHSQWGKRAHSPRRDPSWTHMFLFPHLPVCYPLPFTLSHWPQAFLWAPLTGQLFSWLRTSLEVFLHELCPWPLSVDPCQRSCKVQLPWWPKQKIVSILHGHDRWHDL